MAFLKWYGPSLRPFLKRLLLALLPVSAIERIRSWRAAQAIPPVGRVRLGDLRRLTPLSRQFGYDRGRPVDRYYIERFLAHYADDIRGRVLEIGDATYTRQFGGSRVTASDVLNITPKPGATIVADLVSAEDIPSNTFDCIILTQTLQFFYDVRVGLQTLYRILKPGGVLLATFPGITHIDQGEWSDSWYWSLTTRSARRLFHEVFSPQNCRIEAHGNVLVATTFLYGLAVEELKKEELDYHDPDYECVLTARVQKLR